MSHPFLKNDLIPMAMRGKRGKTIDSIHIVLLGANLYASHLTPLVMRRKEVAFNIYKAFGDPNRSEKVRCPQIQPKLSCLRSLFYYHSVWFLFGYETRTCLFLGYWLPK